MKSLIRTLLVLSCALTIGIATQVEAKSKHKDKEHKEKTHKEKHGKKDKNKDPVPEIKKEEPKPLPPLPVEQPIEAAIVVESPAIIGERLSK